MSTAAARRRFEHLFFCGLVLLLGGYVALGFWKTYLGVGLAMAPLPSLLVHVHAILFVGWIVLFGVQTALVAGGRVSLHRRLGVIAGGWAAAMITIGMATTVMAFRRPGSGVSATVFAGDLGATIAFAALLAAGLRRRRHAPEHKRLMALATAALMGPAIIRWPFDLIQNGPVYAPTIFYLLPPLLIMAYDLASRRRVYGVTWLGLGLMVAAVASFIVLPAWPGWGSFTDWVRAA